MRVTLNVQEQTRKLINAYTDRFNMYSADHFVEYMLQLMQVHFIVYRDGVEELVELAYLPPRIKQGWIIKGIKTEEFITVENRINS